MGWIECLCLYNSDRPGGFFSLGVMIRCCCMYSILLCLRDDDTPGAEAGRAGTELSRRAEVYIPKRSSKTSFTIPDSFRATLLCAHPNPACKFLRIMTRMVLLGGEGWSAARGTRGTLRLWGTPARCGAFCTGETLGCTVSVRCI
jgi:hypothetical protein